MIGDCAYIRNTTVLVYGTSVGKVFQDLWNKSMGPEYTNGLE